MPSAWKRSRSEAILAILIATALVLASVGALWFFVTISPGFTDPAAVPSATGVAPDARNAAVIEQARRLARSRVVEENLPGLSLAVGLDGNLAWAEGFGWADIEQRTPVTAQTRFRIGSVSRTLTAAAVGVLYDRGLLDLDAPVQQYVPSYPAKQWPVSTRHLMADAAGVHHVRDGHERTPDGHCSSVADALEAFRDDPLLFRPGTEYRYSTHGWILVSAAIEGAAKEPFLAFVKRGVLDPLGLADTVPDEDRGVKGRTTFYFPRTAQRTSLGMQVAPEADYSCYAGAGAFLSTPADLVRFGLAMQKPGLLKADTITLLQTPFRLESGATSGFALGWKIEHVPLAGRQVRMAAHRASAMGGTTALLTFPDLGVVVAATSNVSYARGVEPLALRIAELLTSDSGSRDR